MTRTTIVSTGLASALVAAAILSGAVASGQARNASSAPLPAPDVEVHIKITGKALYRDGSGPADPSGQAPLGIGESPSYQFSTNRIGDECSFGMSMSMTPTLTPPQPVPTVWWVVTADLVSRQLDGATVDISWQRRLNDAVVTGPAIIDRARRLTLIEGRPHILDYVPIESDSGNCDAFLIQAEVLFVDPPAVAESTLQYEIWLVETGPEGDAQATRVAMTGEQAESVEYEFEPQQFDTAGSRQRGGPLTMNVGGTVKGRARTDGRIDLIVDARQWFGTDSAGRTSYAGKKTLIVSPGEVVEIAVPPASGRLGDFDLRHVFAGRRTALRVVARIS